QLAAHRAAEVLQVVHVHVEGARLRGDRVDLRLRGRGAALALEGRPERDVDGAGGARLALVDVGCGALAVDLVDRELPADLAGRRLERHLDAAAVRRRRGRDLVRFAELNVQ